MSKTRSPGGSRFAAIDVRAAAAAIREHVRRTPLIHQPELSEHLGEPVYLKLESLQVTGSFKVRGAACRMTALTDEQRRVGVVTCSSGNHGRAVAFMAERLGIPATVCVPEWVDPVKLRAMERSGARVIRTGATYDEADEQAHALAAAEGLAFIHPFDDPRVVAGQGTIALEILEDLPQTGSVVVPLSGGGLCGGIALALDQERPRTHVVGVSAERAAVMLASLRAGRTVTVEEEPTIANALSGGIGLDNRWSFDLVRDFVDAHVSVTEEQIRDAMRFARDALNLIVEGGGAVGIAAILGGSLRAGGQEPPAPAADRDLAVGGTHLRREDSRLIGPVVVVVSGGNVDPAVLAAL